MRIKHRVPVFEPKSAELTEEYAREVEAATARLERAYAAAQRRLDKAITRAETLERKAKPKSVHDQNEVAIAWALVELRRVELDKYARMMASTAQPSVNRGRKSYRPAPTTRGGRT